MPVRSAYLEGAYVPRLAVHFPLELPPPEDFDPARLETWPEVEGRLEYVGGKLLYMPPCGDSQQKTAIDVAGEIRDYLRTHRGYSAGGNEAGMRLGGEVRAADAAIWRSDRHGDDSGRLPREPPILAIEIAGKDETLDALTGKARWYLDHGVQVVWLLDPATRTACALTGEGAQDLGPGGRMPEHPALPGFTPALDDLFAQVSRRS